MTNREELLNNTDAVENLTFEPVEKRYTRVVMLNTALTYLLSMTIPVALLMFDSFADSDTIFISAVVIIALVCIVNISVAGKACRFRGYALREKDITYRKGLFFHNITTIPFCKVQQVSINQSPVARLFSLYTVEISNGSAWQSSIKIPGLTKIRAELIKQHITNKLSNGAE